MSVDTSHARPTSPVTDWASLAKQIIDEQPSRAAAARERLRHPSPQPRTVAEDVAYYTELLTVPAVRASKSWFEDVKRRRDAAKAELAAMGGEK